MSENGAEILRSLSGEDKTEAVQAQESQVHSPQPTGNDVLGGADQESKAQMQEDGGALIQVPQGEESQNQVFRNQVFQTEDNQDQKDSTQGPFDGQNLVEEIPVQARIDANLEDGANTPESLDYREWIKIGSMPDSITSQEYDRMIAAERRRTGQASSEQNPQGTRYVEEEIIVRPAHPPASRSHDPSSSRRKPSEPEGSSSDETTNRHPPTRKSGRRVWYPPPSDERPESAEEPVFDPPTLPTTALSRAGGNPTDDHQPLAFLVDFAGVKGLALEKPFIWRHPVDELLEGESGPAEIMQTAKISERQSITEPVLRWIHLPANNMEWVEVICNLSFISPCLTFRRSWFASSAERSWAPMIAPISSKSRFLDRITGPRISMDAGLNTFTVVS